MSASNSVIKTLQILELISKSEKGLTLTEIYKALNLSKTTVYDILQALYMEDAVYFKDENLKTYTIGSKLFQIGQTYTKNSNFIAFAEPLLKPFANKYSLTTFACKRLATKLTFVYKFESSKTRLTTPGMGEQIPLYDNVAGECFLAFVSEKKYNELINDIVNFDDGGVMKDELKKTISKMDTIRKQGYVFDNGESDPFICDLAAPVYNFEGKMRGVIYATRFVMDKNKDDIDGYIKEFLDIAKEISIKQGYQGK